MNHYTLEQKARLKEQGIESPDQIDLEAAIQKIEEKQEIRIVAWPACSRPHQENCFKIIIGYVLHVVKTVYKENSVENLSAII